MAADNGRMATQIFRLSTMILHKIGDMSSISKMKSLLIEQSFLRLNPHLNTLKAVGRPKNRTLLFIALQCQMIFLVRVWLKLFLTKPKKNSFGEGIFNIKVDTNVDNAAMLSILNSCGYKYRGYVYFRGSARKAFEKILA